MNFDFIKTDNVPLLDSLIYHVKKMALTCVLKDEEEAMNNETLESHKKSDIYISCIEGRATLDLFTITREFLQSKTSFSEPVIEQCLKDYTKLSDSIQSTLLKILVDDYINNYEELNNYYRMLNGKPNINDTGIYIPEDLIPSDLKSVNSTTYIHLMPMSTLDVLYSLGVIDKLIELYPDKKYLNYLGSKSISIYNARISQDFDTLYLYTDVPNVVYNRFNDKLNLNRDFTLQTVYSSAFKYGSDYYNDFIRTFIIIQTMVDLISDLPDMIIKGEIFDIRMVEFIFKSNGIDFFPEIPLQYQLALVRNLNRLLEFKSTTRNIIDICSIFGFDNIEVFKYYILRERKTDSDRNYTFNYKEVKDEDGKINKIEDCDKNYELKFLKVPINDIADNYLYDNSNKIDYEEMIESDPYWNGTKSHDQVKSEILNRKFNYEQSKYLSIDTIYNMTEMSFELSYFFNMLFDNVDAEEQLTLPISFINNQSSTYKFLDIICYLLGLAYTYNGLTDNIMDTQSKIMYIKGFNFEADIQTLSNYVAEKGYTLEQLGVSDFQIPKGQVLTYNQLLQIFTKNKQIYDHVVDQLINANNKDIYDIYKTVYDSLMICKLNFEFFKKPDGTIAKTFTDFLYDRNIILYNSLIEIKNIGSEELKQDKIRGLINDIITVIDEVVNIQQQYKFIFSSLPSVSAEAVKGYIYKIINFFKSFKVDICNINTVYLFDDRNENTIKIIDRIIIQHHLNKTEFMDIIDKPTLISKLNKQDYIQLLEKIGIDRTYWIDRYWFENMFNKEYLEFKITKEIQDYFDIKDHVSINYNYTT